jgi:hypothetical protein
VPRARTQVTISQQASVVEVSVRLVYSARFSAKLIEQFRRRLMGGSVKDRRLRRRAPTILEGRIRIEGRPSDVECTVRDISEAGAQVFLHSPVELPVEFTLSIPKRGISSRARVMWSRDRRHGVMLIREQTGSEQVYPDSLVSNIHSTLNDARSQLAQLMGLPEQSIQVNFEVNRSPDDQREG